MKKPFTTLFALLLILALASPCLAAESEGGGSAFDSSEGVVASSQNSKKVVSVVYDDSTSMSADNCINWSYANYAFQSFYAMLNHGDVLYFTTTAAPSRTTRYDTVDKQAHVDDIRGYFDAGNTFIESAQTAMDALLKHEDASDMLEYWLVIITDGEFYDRNYDRLTGTMLNDIIGSYAEQMMPNGSVANVAYVPIGSMTLRVEEDENKNIFVRSARDTESIISAISQVAQLMSRSTAIGKISFADFSVDSPTSIRIRTELPVRSICVMLNHSSAKLVDARNSDGKIRATECLSLKYPEYTGCVTDYSLYGSISFVGGGSAMVDGEYILSFDAEFAPEDVEVFIEPALELRLAVFDTETQKPLKTLDPLYTKQSLYARYEIFNSLTGEILPLDDYFNEINLGIQYGTPSSVFAFAADRGKRLDDLELWEEPMYVSAMAELDDLAVLRANLYFTPEVYVDYEVVWNGAGADIARTSLIGNTTAGYGFTVLANGERLPGGELKRMGLTVELNTELPNVECLTSINKDGAVIVTPHYLTDDSFPAILLNWLPTYLLRPGEMNVSAGVYSEYAKAQISSDFTLNVTKEHPVRTVINILQPFLFILTVVGYVVRPRFAKRSRLYVIPLQRDENGYSSRLKSWRRSSPRGSDRQKLPLRMLVPFIPQSYRLGSVRIYADGFPGGKRKGIAVKNNGNVIKARKCRDFTLNSHIPVRLADDTLTPIDITGGKKIAVQYGQAMVLTLDDGSSMLVGARYRNDVEETFVKFDNTAIPEREAVTRDVRTESDACSLT